MILIRQKFIFREDLRANPHLLYVFGDNSRRVGMAGQAKEMRHEPNAHGIATKVAPGIAPGDFFCDDLPTHWAIVRQDFHLLKEKVMSGAYAGLVVPSDGLGSGLSRLDVLAPNLYAFINNGWHQRLQEV